MGSFQDKWSKPQKQGFAEKITDTLKPKGALKPLVEAEVKRLQAQISKMDGMVSQLKHRDKEIYQNIVLNLRDEGIGMRGFSSPITIRNISNDIDDTFKYVTGFIMKNQLKGPNF